MSYIRIEDKSEAIKSLEESARINKKYYNC